MLESNNRYRQIKVYVTDKELLEIEQRAEKVSQSASRFLRNLGLGYTPKSAFDQEAMQNLIKLHADQGRLGGLLKLWLSERKGEAVTPEKVRAILKQIEFLQVQLIEIVMTEKKRH
jgi:hypothetical protein